MGTVVCCVDDSESTAAVVHHARRLAQALGLELVLVNVQPRTEAPGVSAAPAGQSRLHESELRDAEELLARVAASEGLGEVARTRATIAGGSVGAAILEVAADEDAELVVIGSRGRRGLKAALLGSVSSEVAANASCPCVIVPPHAVGTA